MAQIVFSRKAIFQKSILSSHIFASANRIMIEVIFANLTEEKNDLAFSFSSSVNEQIQKSVFFPVVEEWERRKP